MKLPPNMQSELRLILDNEMLMRYVPHSIKPVSGETALFDKITVHLESAESWVEQNFTGSELLNDIDALNPALVDALRLLVVADALDRAVPSLDLVLTPNGFGVVNTNTVAAASKQRVDRLIGSLRELRDGAIEQALSLLPGEEDWVETPQAHYFATTLFPNIDLCTLCSHNSGRWEKYVELRSRAVGIELTLAEDYFSPELMSELRLLNLLGTMSSEQRRVVQAIRSQVVEVLQGNPINGNRMRDIVNFIRYRPGVFRLWHTSATAKLFSPPKFENKKDSKGYWF